MSNNQPSLRQQFTDALLIAMDREVLPKYLQVKRDGAGVRLKVSDRNVAAHVTGIVEELKSRGARIEDSSENGFQIRGIFASSASVIAQKLAPVLVSDMLFEASEHDTVPTPGLVLAAAGS